MTDLQLLYAKARLEGSRTHGHAVRQVARWTGLDPDSVRRALARARREDERDEKKRQRTKEAKA